MALPDPRRASKTAPICGAVILMCAGYAGAAGGADAAVSSTKPDIAAAAVVEDHYPTQIADFPGGVKGYANLVFESLPGYRPLTLDVYAKPARGGRPRPLIIYIHGGGWMGGQSRQSGAFVNFPGVLAGLSASGYVVASVTYRLSGEARFPAAIQDAKLAVRWLRAHAVDYNIDPGHVIVWGASAGGELAGLLATTCGNQALAPPLGDSPDAAGLKVASDCVQGAVLWYGALDFTQLHPSASPSSPDSQYLGCEASACPEKARLASPTLMIDRHTPPVLLAFGNNDKVVPPAQSEDFHKRMLAAGLQCDMLEMDGIGHSFVGTDQAATRKATLAALDATVKFFHRIAPPVS